MATTRQRDDAVRIEGLNETLIALKAMGVGLEVAIRVANKEAASLVATGAQSKAGALGGVAAHVAPSIKASAGAKFGAVAFGGPAFPMGAGAEFGGGRRPTTQQFKPWLGHTGYFVYPTIRAKSDEINEQYREQLDRIIKEAGLA